MLNRTYIGLPENYLVVPKPGDKETDVDALHCALTRASAVCKLIVASVGNNDETGPFSPFVILDACWALDGLIDQSLILLNGRDVQGMKSKVTNDTKLADNCTDDG